MRHHLRPRHLVPLIDTSRATRVRFQPPEWLPALLDDFSEHIEPFSGDARLGYEIRFADPHWELDLFLGSNEVIGGDADGQFQYVNFRTDIARILSLFTSVYRCEWIAMTENDRSQRELTPADSRCGLRIEAEYGGQDVWVTLKSVPPVAVMPGLKRYPNGNYELA